MSTYYEILGVPQNADEAAIRKAYLRASLRCHPDKNPGREEEAKVSIYHVVFTTCMIQYVVSLLFSF